MRTETGLKQLSFLDLAGAVHDCTHRNLYSEMHIARTWQGRVF